MSAYATLPQTAKVKPDPFTISIPEDKLQEFKQILKLSPIGPDTYENQQDDRKFGTTRKWLSEAKVHWETAFDW